MFIARTYLAYYQFANEGTITHLDYTVTFKCFRQIAVDEERKNSQSWSGTPTFSCIELFKPRSVYYCQYGPFQLLQATLLPVSWLPYLMLMECLCFVILLIAIAIAGVVFADFFLKVYICGCLFSRHELPLLLTWVLNFVVLSALDSVTSQFG